MVFFEFSEKHNTDDPPMGIVQGTLSGDPGKYDLRIVLEDSRTTFASPKEVTIPQSGSTPVDLPIDECSNISSTELRTARVLAQQKKSDINEDFADGASKFINYRCA